ncbi:channel protein TolC [Saccharobesus litoralis]|uniref:Channel protein TolC n=1 Tax=Saccharobesus litoralis TaxID=2172099 RepID=A0A2S0VRX8_9ALTE|nr:TolC family outer membrane protein [Saccharobesus litoralis]AWB66959.1 channel protein TolC [Saccharobesus litoralis]
MKLLRQTYLFALFGVALFVPGQSLAKSLEQAVATAFNTNPDLKEIFHNYKASRQEQEIAEGGWYPSIDINASVGAGIQDTPESRLNTPNAQSEDIRPVTYGISLSQILFDGFFTSENVERTSFEAQSELYALQAAAENKALEVANIYLNVIRDAKLVELATKNVNSHTTIHEQIKLRTDNGLGSASDLSQATGRLARANANLITAQNNLYDSTAAYIRLVGEKPEELILPVPDKLMLPASEGLLLDKSMLNHPTVKSAIADIKAAEAQLSQNQSSFMPRVTLEVGKNYTADRANDGIERDTLRADIVMNYNLFRGWQDSALEMQNAYQIEQAKDIKMSAERQVIEGAKFSWNSYSFTDRQLEFLKLHVEQSFLTQQAYQEQFELGRRTLLDLLDTENELFEARRNFVTAETEYLHAHYRVFNAMGDLLKALRIQGDEYWRDTIEKEQVGTPQQPQQQKTTRKSASSRLERFLGIHGNDEDEG